MEFFYLNDWFGREGPFAFTLEHFAFIFLAILVALGLSFLLRKKNKGTIKGVLIGLWVFALLIEIFAYTVRYVNTALDPVNNPFNIETMLPLHSCSMFMFIFPFAIFPKNRVIRTAASNFLVVVNMIMGFITMFVGCLLGGKGVFSFFGLESLVYHAIIFIVPFVMVMTNYYDLKKWDILYGEALFLGLSLIMWLFDHFTGSDYFNIYDGHNFGILYEISENVPHLVWTLIVMSCYIITAFIIHFSIYGIKYLIKKKKKDD